MTASFAEGLFWYTITETDGDPLPFLLHLIYAFDARLPQVVARPASLVGEGDQAGVWRPALGALINELSAALDGESFLVLDDYHLANAAPEALAIVEHLASLLPAQLHLVLATRQAPSLPGLTQWRAKGDVLDISHHELAFTEEETEALFRTEYGRPLTPAQVHKVAAETEGWAIALADHLPGPAGAARGRRRRGAGQPARVARRAVRLPGPGGAGQAVT